MTPFLPPDKIETALGLMMSTKHKLKSADGAELNHLIHKTIHRMPGGFPGRPSVQGSPATFPNQQRKPMLLMPAGRRRKPIAPSLSMDTRVVEIRSTGIALSYDITEIHARSGERLAIRYINAGDMIHNIVIVKDESDIIPVGVAAMAAHGDEFIPRDKRDRIVAYSRLAGPGKRLRWSSPYRHRESIPYICTYSGHFTMKQGRLIVRE